MLKDCSDVGTIPLLRHIFFPDTPQSSISKGRHQEPIAVDKEFYTRLTDQLLDQFYPRFCCKEKLSQVDGKRELMLRCPYCHKQQSRLTGPLRKLRVPRWYFSYLLTESVRQYPKVLTIVEIKRRLGLTSMGTAYLLKRRLQLFASEVLPRMQEAFYRDNKLRFRDFNLPKDREADLTDIVRDLPIPQADTVVLYSCGTLANKGRKRFKRTGQTSSIYMSESLGGMQRGTLVSTIGVKNGPVFYDSIPNQKAETINPILGKYIPVHNPLFTDEGYRGYPGKSHRMVNHSRKSQDKRYKWARNRWSKNGVHCNVAEGNQAVLKRAFKSYVWINPKHSTLALNEFAFLGNLRYFSLNDLLPEESRTTPVTQYHLDDNWALRHSGKKLRRGSLVHIPRKARNMNQRPSPWP